VGRVVGWVMVGWVVADGVGGVVGWLVVGGVGGVIGWVTGGWAGGDPAKGRLGVEIAEREGVVDDSELSRGGKSGEYVSAGG